jgi:molecular chaperone DnaJ
LRSKRQKINTKKFTARIPAGVNTGTKIRFQSMGHCGENGGANGDVYAIISINSHLIFNCDGSNVIINYPITKRTAEYGGIINIPTLEKDNIYPMQVPPNTQDQDSYSIQNAGIPFLNGKARGDIIIVLRIYDPRNVPLEIRGMLNRINKFLETKNQI